MSPVMEVQKRAVTSVTIHPRQRKEYDQEKLDELAASIKRTKGLIHPIVIDPEDESLVAGGRRLQAYMLLSNKYPDEGWGEIPFIYKGQEDDLFRKVCELEENLHRVNLQWWEEAAAIAEIDSIQREIAEANGETWNMRKTAEMVGKSVGTVQQSVELVKVSKEKPAIKEEKTLTGALAKVKTEKQIEQRKKEIERKSSGAYKTFPAEIIVGDASELIRKEPDNEFDCIVTNFPFGVEYGYSGRADKLYNDEEDMIVDLVRDVVHESHRILKPDSWFFGFFDVRKITYSNPMKAFFTRMKQILNEAKDHDIISKEIWEASLEMGHKAMGLSHWFEEAGYDYVRLMPIIWAKPNKTQGNIGDPRKGLVVAYEAAIMACKGDGILLKQGKQDIFIVDTVPQSERDFGMQMPRYLCKEIISWLTLGKGRVLDPFAGVGSFGEGALDNQCSFKGFELNKERAEIGNLRLREHTFAAPEDSNE